MLSIELTHVGGCPQWCMGSRLPVVSGRDAKRAFERAGFEHIPGRGKGSHMVMKRGIVMLTIPDHDPLKRGILRALIRQSGLTVEQFVELLK